MANNPDETSAGHYGPSQTALLLLDFHRLFVEKLASPGGRAALENAVKLREWAKSKDILVIHCLVDTKASPFPTCKGRSQLIETVNSMVKSGGAAEPDVLMQGANQDEPTFVRVPGYVSALKSCGLTELLMTEGIKSLLISGLSTSGCVLRTAMAATDAEYVVTVISDACADGKEGVHDMVTKVLLPSRSYVSTTADFIDSHEQFGNSRDQSGVAR